MKEYAIAIFAVCILGGVLDLISFGRLKSAERLAVGIITLYVIISPLATVLGQLENDDFIISPDIPGSEYDQIYIDRAEEAFCLGISRAVADRFDLDAENVRTATRNFDFQNMRAEKIYVALSGAASLADYRAVEAYINKMNIGVCECEIEIK